MIHARQPRNTSLLIAAGFLSAILTACQTTRESDVFAVIDSNKDGQLTLTEVETYGFKRMFNRFDRNRDGVITEGDLQGNATNLMRQRDLNHNGQITYSEYSSAGHRKGTVKKLFTSADTDGNGSISRKEKDAYLSAGGMMLGD